MKKNNIAITLLALYVGLVALFALIAMIYSINTVYKEGRADQATPIAIFVGGFAVVSAIVAFRIARGSRAAWYVWNIILGFLLLISLLNLINIVSAGVVVVYVLVPFIYLAIVTRTKRQITHRWVSSVFMVFAAVMLFWIIWSATQADNQELTPRITVPILAGITYIGFILHTTWPVLNTLQRKLKPAADVETTDD